MLPFQQFDLLFDTVLLNVVLLNNSFYIFIAIQHLYSIVSLTHLLYNLSFWSATTVTYPIPLIIVRSPPPIITLCHLYSHIYIWDKFNPPKITLAHNEVNQFYSMLSYSRYSQVNNKFLSVLKDFFFKKRAEVCWLTDIKDWSEAMSHCKILELNYS